jgi:hypothetical protein
VELTIESQRLCLGGGEGLAELSVVVLKQAHSRLQVLDLISWDGAVPIFVCALPARL